MRLRLADFWGRRIGLLLLTVVVCATVGFARFVLGSHREYLQERRVSLLNAPAVSIRRFSAFFLGANPETTPAAVPGLVAALRDPDGMVRAAAAESLGKVGFLDSMIADALGRAMRDTEPAVRGAAAWSLGKLGGTAASTQDALILGLKDGHSYVRRQSAWALGQIGQSHSRALKILYSLLSDPTPEVRSWAAFAVSRLDSGVEVERALRELREDANPETRKFVEELSCVVLTEHYQAYCQQRELGYVGTF